LLGRLDDQAKIRGFRIEPGEIEAALVQHPGIRNAVVRVDGHEPARKRLVAYIIAASSRALSIPELRSFLRQKLPDYMIPSAFVFLDNFPATPSGKIDRRALASVDRSRPELGQGYAAPVNRMEEIIAGIWADLLRLDAVGTHDNFFDLGGHSLLATQLVSRMRERFGVELPVRTVFENPTIAQLSGYIQALPGKDTAPPPLDDAAPAKEEIIL
jgi:acyl carrier protein